MKYLASVIMAFLISFPVLSGEHEDKTELIALRMYADWCGMCKALDPKVNQVKEEFKGKGVFFAVFDQTDEFAKEQSALHAKLLGLEHVQKEFEGKTGLLLLIDPKTKEISERITHTITIEDLRKKLTRTMH
jgi:thiol-disulfide isomerase/thioredoxin